jgi:hypothetical protein
MPFFPLAPKKDDKMNYARHRELMKKKQAELSGLEGAVRVKAEEAILAEANAEEVESEEIASTEPTETKKRGRKPKA